MAYLFVPHRDATYARYVITNLNAMKYLIFISIITLSCNYSNQPNNNGKESEQVLNKTKEGNKETLKIDIQNAADKEQKTLGPIRHNEEATFNDIEVDDYKIDFTIISANVAQNSNTKTDRAYFISADNSQFIEIILATDYYKENIYHYLIETNGIIYPSNELTNSRESLNENIKNASRLDLDMFTTVKGVKLGDSIEDVVSKYGEYDEMTLEQNLEILKWNYFGREMLEYGERNDENLRIAKNSLGQSNVFYFESNKLIAIETSNYVP